MSMEFFSCFCVVLEFFICMLQFTWYNSFASLLRFMPNYSLIPYFVSFWINEVIMLKEHLTLNIWHSNFQYPECGINLGNTGNRIDIRVLIIRTRGHTGISAITFDHLVNENSQGWLYMIYKLGFKLPHCRGWLVISWAAIWKIDPEFFLVV